jgi:hypothetical protein
MTAANSRGFFSRDEAGKILRSSSLDPASGALQERVVDASGRKPLAALGAPGVDHCAATARLHAHEEPVRALAFDDGGLKRSFGGHDSNPRGADGSRRSCLQLP